MKPFKHSRGFAVLACTAALAGAPGSSSAMEEGFYMGLSASAESLDATLFKTTDNTHPMNMSPSSGRIFHVRDSDTQTTSGFGVLAGYTFHPGNRELYLSAEIDLAYHGGKTRGRLEWIKDSAARERAGSDPDWPQSGESWPDDWTFEKDRSYGLTLRLGGPVDALTPVLGAGSGIYALAGVRRVEAEYVNDYEGCPRDDDCSPEGRGHVDFLVGQSRTDRTYTVWAVGAGLHKPLGHRVGMQIEAYYAAYDAVSLLLLDTDKRVVHEVDAKETGLRLRLLRYF